MVEKELQSLLLKLADADVRQVFFEYEGSGDSGGIDNIYISKKQVPHDDLKGEQFLPHQIGEYVDDVVNIRDHFKHDIVDKIEKMCYSLILNHLEDWYNNEGGYGWIMMDIPSGKTFCKNTIRYVETETYNHDINLIENLNMFK